MASCIVFSFNIFSEHLFYFFARTLVLLFVYLLLTLHFIVLEQMFYLVALMFYLVALVGKLIAFVLTIDLTIYCALITWKLTDYSKLGLDKLRPPEVV